MCVRDFASWLSNYMVFALAQYTPAAAMIIKSPRRDFPDAASYYFFNARYQCDI